MMGSATAQRKQKLASGTKLNLVSLMDIFTILVFFLLLNSGDSQNLDKAHTVKLPGSSATPTLRDELVILVGEDNILVEDVLVANTHDVLNSPDKPISALVDQLQQYAEREGELDGYQKEHGRSVTIMGDKTVPYSLLKSVMATCSQQNFRNISLAVNQVSYAAVVNSGSSSLTSLAEG